MYITTVVFHRDVNEISERFVHNKHKTVYKCSNTFMQPVYFETTVIHLTVVELLHTIFGQFPDKATMNRR